MQRNLYAASLHTCNYGLNCMTTETLPAGWTYEHQGPTNDSWWNDAHALGVSHDRSETPTRYVVVHAADGMPATRRDGTTREHANLEDALADAARGE